MKIYEIGTGYTPIPATISAATEIIVEELSCAFLNQNVEISVVDLKCEERAKTDFNVIDVWVPKIFRGTDIKLGILHKLKRVIYSINLALKLRCILKQTKEKIILHFHNQYNMFFFIKLTPKKLLKKCSMVYTNHNGVWRMEWAKAQPIIKKKYFQEYFCMKQAELVIALNKETKENLVNHLQIDSYRIKCIPNGVNTNKYRPYTDTEKNSAKEKHNLLENRMILQVGSICENKGQLRSLKLLLPIIKENPDLVFGYAGGVIEPQYKESIEQFAFENGISDRIKYFGMVAPGKSLCDLYNCAIATIFPSVYEAFGLVAIESLSCQIPVLCNKNAVFKFGDGAIYYDENDFEEVFEKSLSNNKNYVDLCFSARGNAVENYSWSSVAKLHLEAFNEL